MSSTRNGNRDALYFQMPHILQDQGRFHCLFKGSQTLADFFRYPDQRCLALYLQEALRFRAHILQLPTRPDTTQKITTFFSVLPLAKGTKRPTDMDTEPVPRSMRIRGTASRPTRSQQHVCTRSLPERRTRSSRPQHHANSYWRQLSGRPTSSSDHQTLLNFPQFYSFSLGRQEYQTFLGSIHFKIFFTKASPSHCVVLHLWLRPDLSHTSAQLALFTITFCIVFVFKKETVWSSRIVQTSL